MPFLLRSLSQALESLPADLKLNLAPSGGLLFQGSSARSRSSRAPGTSRGAGLTPQPNSSVPPRPQRCAVPPCPGRDGCRWGGRAAPRRGRAAGLSQPPLRPDTPFLIGCTTRVLQHQPEDGVLEVRSAIWGVCSSLNCFCYLFFITPAFQEP